MVRDHKLLFVNFVTIIFEVPVYTCVAGKVHVDDHSDKLRYTDDLLFVYFPCIIKKNDSTKSILISCQYRGNGI